MGNELDNPILSKNSLDKETEYIKFSSSSVQGWKTQMEEYRFFLPEIFPNTDKKIDIFGIFSGEGGPEVAKYICNKFPDKILSNNNFKEGKYQEALKETFIELDNSLNTEKGKLELKKIQKEFNLDKNAEIKLINNTCGNGDYLPERELEQIKCIKDLLNPRNLSDYNISFFSGCSGLVIIITNNKIYIANIGNIRCIPIDTNSEVIIEKVNKINIISNDAEKERIKFSQNFKEKKIYEEFIEISRGFGFFEYKENKWLKPEDQAISSEPEILEINYEQCKYLIIGSNGLFEQGDNDDEIFYNKCNKKIAEYFVEKINDDKNKEKKVSNLIEEYFDKIIPKKKSNNNFIKYENYMNNISCAIIQLFPRPILPEIKKEETKEDKKGNSNSDKISEKQKQEDFKKLSNNNKSMKNLFSFIKKNNNSVQNENEQNKFSKTDKKGKKLESSSSFTNIFKRKQNK